MSQKIFIVDAFTDRPFSGNPAGVCVMTKAADESWMRLVAREVNLAETAFLYPVEVGYHLRWFTPKAEIPLCGHATLASASILWGEGLQPAGTILRFQSMSGQLTAKQLEDGWIELDFPVIANNPASSVKSVLQALGVSEGIVVETYRNFLVELSSEEGVRTLSPDMGAVSRLNCQGVIVTAKANPGKYDFVSRYFAPAVGINEDPVTGSAHCALTPYWAAKLGKTTMLAYQASERGGEMRVTLKGDRVLLAGQGVKMFNSELVV